jgi:inosose dehydratase
VSVSGIPPSPSLWRTGKPDLHKPIHDQPVPALDNSEATPQCSISGVNPGLILSTQAAFGARRPQASHLIVMEERSVTRREAVRKAAIMGFLLSQIRAAPNLNAEDIARPKEPGEALPNLKLGVATYSLRKLPVDAAIEALKAMQITSVSVYKQHVPILVSTPDVCREMAQKFRRAGITLTSTGVVQLTSSEGVMRRAFECGRAAGLATMTASYANPPDRGTFLLTERFVREFDMRLAFHNHGPGDPIFPSPYDVWDAVQPYDERLGLCLDVGHAARAGIDPVEAIFKCRARLYDVHLKDTLSGAGEKDQPVELGFGRLDIRAIMSALQQIHFSYQVGLEDEVESADPIPGVAQSFGYMRGMLAALTPRPLPS